MWRKIILAAVLCILPGPVFAQDIMDAILFLTGASSPEDLDQDVIDGYSSLASRPVPINYAPESRMVSSGLFSRYQAASVADYRRRSGDILSISELALLDGFGEEAALALAPFVSFETRAQPGRSSLESGSVKTELLLRGSMQESEGDWKTGDALKVRTGDADRWLASVALKDFSTWPPAASSFSAAVYGKKRPYTLILGDFNARFGQGLLLWSGFTMSGVQSAAALDRHPSGVSSAWTFSPDAAHRGAAADIAFGRIILSGFCSAGKCSGANLTWNARSGQVGLTAILSDGKGWWRKILSVTNGGSAAEEDTPVQSEGGAYGQVSADWRWSAGKFDLFGEMAVDIGGRTVATVAGAAWNPAYQVRLAAALRGYPSSYEGAFAAALRSSTRTTDEYGASLALDYRKLTLTADVSNRPGRDTRRFKSILKYAPHISRALSLSARAVCRYASDESSPWRSEIRAEAALAATSGFYLRCCGALTRCVGTAWLVYSETGWRVETDRRKASFYIRGTAFKADDWADRIYIYERDVPGAFSVPAWYGRGCAASAVASLKGRHITLSARAYVTAYPGMAEKKPGKTGLKLQCQFTF